MKITSLGHASLLVESGDQRVLVDPVFEEQLLGGAVCYAPGRAIDPSALPRPTTVVVTHAHFDHFHLASLEQLPRDVPVLTPDDEVRPALQAAGFRDVRPLDPWRPIVLGALTLCPTPSDHGEPECGLYFRDATGGFWHMADGEVTPRVAHRLRARHGSVDVVAAKYQPVVRASMGHLRGHGAQFDKQEVLTWLETAAVSEPQLVFPFASGLSFAGAHAWFNRYAFPLSPADVVSILGPRLRNPGRVAVVAPGDVIDLAGGAATLREQASPFVRATSSSAVAWEPVDTSTLAGLDDPTDRVALDRELARALEGEFLAWLRAQVASDASPWSTLRRSGVVWQLVVHAGGGERLAYFVDFRDVPAPHRGFHPTANSFTHLGGATLLAVLRGSAPALLFWLAGQARSFEKVFFVEGGTLRAPELPRAPQHHLGDPLTFYLRHGGSPDVGPHPAHHERAHARDLHGELLAAAAAGRSRSLELLGRLAIAEAERRGLQVGTPQVRETSDAFRRQLGLLEEEDLAAWWREAGLDAESYTRLMTGIAAARAVEQDGERER